MPLISSLLPTRPTSRCSRSPSSPHQLARMPIFSAGWAMIAGVHSTVWILAISAELTSWAVPKSSSSLICGCCFFNASQIALCSRVKSVCSMPRPIHQFSLNPVIAVPVLVSSGSRPSCSTSLPSVNVRTRRCCSSELP